MRKQEAHKRRKESHQDVHAQVRVALGDDRGAEKGHRHHDEDLHLVGAEQRQAEQIAANHIGEVEQHGDDERERQHNLDARVPTDPGPCRPSPVSPL